MSNTIKSDQQSPYFKLFPRDFFASSSVARMDSETQGIYLLLLMREWLDGYISDDIEDLACMLRLPLEVFEKHWKRIKGCFYEVGSEPGKLTNSRIEAERASMLQVRNTQSVNAKRAAEVRWGHQRGSDQSSKLGVHASALRSNAESNTDECHADAQADANTKKAAAVYSTVAEQSATAPALSSSKTTGVASGERLEWSIPEPPSDLPIAWPEPGAALRVLAARFLRIFGNCTTEKAHVRHIPAYIDVLAAMSARPNVRPYDAWRAFANARDAHSGKTLFGAQAKSALSYLRSSSKVTDPVSGAHDRHQRYSASATTSKPQLVTTEFLAAMQ